MTQELQNQNISEFTDSSQLPFYSEADKFTTVFDQFKKSIDLSDYKKPDFSDEETTIEFENYAMKYGDGDWVLSDINIKLPKNKIIAIIGPSGCGKSTFLRSINRMNEEMTDITTQGTIKLNGKNILTKETNVNNLRTKIGMIFQKPSPFPLSIYDNIVFGPKIHGVKNKDQLDKIVEQSLQSVGLWEEVNHRLEDHAMGLSGGQQQRLCIARAIAIRPDIILCDEPASALDPKSTYQIEDLLIRLKENYTVVIVTHNMQQAARISDYCIFMYSGNIIEYEKTEKMFENPFYNLTENYISGKFG